MQSRGEMMNKEEMLRAAERELQQIQEAITNVVMRNESCRSEFVRNPRAAIKKYLNIELPAELNISAIDQSDPSMVTFVLPHCVDASCSTHQSNGSVNSSQLNSVAGALNGLRADQLNSVAGGFGVPNQSTVNTAVDITQGLYNMGLGLAGAFGANSDDLEKANQYGNMGLNTFKGLNGLFNK